MQQAETRLAWRQLNLPDDTSETYIAWDDKGVVWLLRYGCEAAESEWTAWGFVNENGKPRPAVVPIENQPSKRYLMSPPIKIRRWMAVGEI